MYSIQYKLLVKNCLNIQLYGFFFFLDKTPKNEIRGHSQPHHPEFKRENTDKLIGGKLI